MTTETLAKQKHTGGRPRIEIEDYMFDAISTSEGSKNSLVTIAKLLLEDFNIKACLRTIARRKKELGV